MTTAPPDFHGIFPYLVSPIDAATGQVLERVLRDLIAHLIARGVHGISPLGSTGEIVYLTAEQRVAIVRATVDAVGGRVPVVPGVSAYSTTDAVRQAEALVNLGVDGLIVMLQTQFPVSRTGIERYFRTIAEAVPVPIVLYTNPGLGGADVTPEIVEALSHVPNIRYVKDASGRTGRILAILNRVGDRVKVFSASAHIPTVVFQLGGVGWMAGPACVIPRESVALYNLARQGRWDEAFAMQRPLWRLNELFEKYSLAACIKTALEIQGFPVGEPIAPQEPLPVAAVEEIRAGLAALAVGG
ncbi:MAG TPA: dihydrodipicolinate synthase family protein [Thermomicrobiales bacterium]|jgi:4-hydroxy-tetrahydrodipicolinate synthase